MCLENVSAMFVQAWMFWILLLICLEVARELPLSKGIGLHNWEYFALDWQSLVR